MYSLKNERLHKNLKNLVNHLKLFVFCVICVREILGTDRAVTQNLHKLHHFSDINENINSGKYGVVLAILICRSLI